MIYYCYVLLLPLFVGTVSAGAWDDFTNNLATDLAPLITLFGEQLTKQSLSESVGCLDNIIFALCPLGILTALVSAIRVCGNSSLKAFIGRAQECPADAEIELLSCVSDSTAELFHNGGISRIFGRPRLLEIATWTETDPESKLPELKIGSLDEAVRAGKWERRGSSIIGDSGLDSGVPNLSLNKGIRKENPLWFHLVAFVGVVLQIGVILYAALTVFVYPAVFQKNGAAVRSYAFPLFTLGTFMLFAGMLSCARLIDHTSKELVFHPIQPSRIYWLQPGSQSVGDQAFGAFLAVSEGPKGEASQNLEYTRSIRDESITSHREESTLFQTRLICMIAVTMIGFVTQFVGFRGLHSSVIITQLASTLLMAFLRTSLRTNRITSKENVLKKKERDLLNAGGQHELDYLALHLGKADLFSIQSASDPNGLVACTESAAPSIAHTLTSERDSVIDVIRIRIRLAQLTSGPNRSVEPPWDEDLAGCHAQRVAQAVCGTLGLLSHWNSKFPRERKLNLRFEWRRGGHNQLLFGEYSIGFERSSDTHRWSVDSDKIKAVLGLWTWSLVKSVEGSESVYCRVVGLRLANANRPETPRYFRKWIYRETEAKMTSLNMVKLTPTSQSTFGAQPVNGPGEHEVLAVETKNSLSGMVAQDLYIHLLNCALDDLKELGGINDVSASAPGIYHATNTRLEQLVDCFSVAGLGTREDALMCIVPVLTQRGLLPELAADAESVRSRVKAFVENGDWLEAFALARWFCEYSEGDALEWSLVEFGFLCRKAMQQREEDVRQLGLKECQSLPVVVKQDTPSRHRIFAAFSEQSRWLTSPMSHETDNSESSAGEKLENNGDDSSSMVSGRQLDEHHTDPAAKYTLSKWLHGFSKQPDVEDMQQENLDIFEQMLNWVCLQDHQFLLPWLMMSWLQLAARSTRFLGYIIALAAKQRSDLAMQTLRRHGVDLDTQIPHDSDFSDTDITALDALIAEGDIGAVERLIRNGARINGSSERHLGGLMIATRIGNLEMVESLLKNGAAVNARDEDGDTALMMAIIANRLDVVKLLLDSGADVNLRNTFDLTALSSAIDKHNIELVELLLQHGADVNARTGDGYTPLMRAVFQNSLDCAKVLLYWGADVTKVSNGKTPLDQARSPGMRELLTSPAAASRRSVPGVLTEGFENPLSDLRSIE